MKINRIFLPATVAMLSMLANEKVVFSRTPAPASMPTGIIGTAPILDSFGLPASIDGATCAEEKGATFGFRRIGVPPGAPDSADGCSSLAAAGENG